MSGKSSRDKGHNAERWHLKWMRRYWPDVMTSRNGSTARDAEGVDFINTSPFNFQSKAAEKIKAAHRILAEMPDDGNYNALLHKRNRQGWTVTLSLEDFLELMDLWKGNGGI